MEARLKSSTPEGQRTTESNGMIRAHLQHLESGSPLNHGIGPDRNQPFAATRGADA